MKFGETQTIDWPTLELVGLAYEVHKFLRDRPCIQLFALDEPAYCELNLEVLATFLDREGADQLEQRIYDTILVMGRDAPDVLHGLLPLSGAV